LIPLEFVNRQPSVKKISKEKKKKLWCICVHFIRVCTNKVLESIHTWEEEKKRNRILSFAARCIDISLLALDRELPVFIFRIHPERYPRIPRSTRV
jgi:7,8-dihydro-6-hydroxymethylpterin-pyrophosphokinase